MEDLEEKYTHKEVGVKSGTTIFKRRFVAVYKWWLEVTCRDWTHTNLGVNPRTSPLTLSPSTDSTAAATSHCRLTGMSAQ